MKARGRAAVALAVLGVGASVPAAWGACSNAIRRSSPVVDPTLPDASRCAHWDVPPVTAGILHLVACDQAALTAYYRSGLTDPGTAHLRIDDPRGPSTSIPDNADFTTAEQLGADSIRSDQPSRATIYVATRSTAGTVRGATFPPETVQPTTPLHVDATGSTWTLRDPTGAAVASVTPYSAASPPHPHDVRLKRGRSRTIVTWSTSRQSAGVRYVVALRRDGALIPLEHISRHKSTAYRTSVSSRRLLGGTAIVIEARLGAQVDYSGAVPLERIRMSSREGTGHTSALATSIALRHGAAQAPHTDTPVATETIGAG